MPSRGTIVGVLVALVVLYLIVSALMPLFSTIAAR
jgi:uncharacterized membrane protein YccC